MPDIISNDPGKILKVAKAILLVDWPNPEVPAALLKAGFTVFGYSPNRYSVAELYSERPKGVENKDFFPLKSEEAQEWIVFRKLEGNPGSVEIVNTYRPEEELSDIIENHVYPLGAKTLWLQPPVTSSWARDYAAKHGLAFIEGTDIAENARNLEG